MFLDYHAFSVTASSKKQNKVLYSIQVIKEDFIKTQYPFPPLKTDTHPHLSPAASVRVAFNNGSRTNKAHPNIRRKRNEKREGGRRGKKREEKKKAAGFSRGSQSVECLMKFLEEVPGPLQRKTQNHSVGGRDREEDSRIKTEKGRQKVNHKKRQRYSENGSGVGRPPSCSKKHL